MFIDELFEISILSWIRVWTKVKFVQNYYSPKLSKKFHILQGRIDTKLIFAITFRKAIKTSWNICIADLPVAHCSALLPLQSIPSAGRLNVCLERNKDKNYFYTRLSQWII